MSGYFTEPAAIFHDQGFIRHPLDGGDGIGLHLRPPGQRIPSFMEWLQHYRMGGGGQNGGGANIFYHPQGWPGTGGNDPGTQRYFGGPPGSGHQGPPIHPLIQALASMAHGRF